MLSDIPATAIIPQKGVVHYRRRWRTTGVIGVVRRARSGWTPCTATEGGSDAP